MKKYLGDDFLLNTKTAQYLYDNHAKSMPIFDFHCHLNPQEIAEDKTFSNITQIWLGGDHYKWRLMREFGVDEKYITGDASDYDKFVKFAEVLPYTIGNPLHHWCHLELKRFFAIDKILSPSTVKEIWDEANKKLSNMSAKKLIASSNVKVLCTTDDPIDTLEFHQEIKKDKNFTVKVLPAYRPDKAINVELPHLFFPWFEKLEKRFKTEVKSFDSFLNCLEKSIEHFNNNGCVCSDHALDVVMYEKTTKEEVSKIFEKVINKKSISESELKQYKGYMLVFFGEQYNKYGWVQQYHIGALRNNSTRYMNTIGPDTGYDATEDQPFASSLSKILDSLDIDNKLPKTILYCLNPRDNEVLATIKNCFQQGGISAKIQFGSAWWFNDQKDGMQRQMEASAQVGLLSKFVGMLTDSRSFLSYPRHEYFRRILCNKFGDLIENGEYPNEPEFVGKIVEDICFNNAIKYFGVKL